MVDEQLRFTRLIVYKNTIEMKKDTVSDEETVFLNMTILIQLRTLAWVLRASTNWNLANAFGVLIRNQNMRWCK